MNHLGEKAMKVVFLIAACASVLAVFLICVFLFANGLPAMGKIGPLKSFSEQNGDQQTINSESCQ